MLLNPYSLIEIPQIKLNINADPTPNLNLPTPSPIDPPSSFSFLQLVILYSLIGGVALKLIELSISFFPSVFKFTSFDNTLKQISHIYDLLIEYKAKVKSSRVIICKVSNGGYIPSVSTELYLSILYEVYSNDLLETKRYWNKRTIDRSFVDFLHTLFKQKLMSHSFSDLSPDSQLFHFFTSSLNLDSSSLSSSSYSCISSFIGYNKHEFLFLVSFFQDSFDSNICTISSNYSSLFSKYFKL